MLTIALQMVFLMILAINFICELLVASFTGVDSDDAGSFGNAHGKLR